MWISSNLNKIDINSNKLCYYDCHFIPQYIYVYDDNNNTLCDNIIYFENLSDEFYELMSKYNIKNITLKHINYRKKCNELKINNISEENRQKIVKFYYLDFKLFNYSTNIT